MNDAQLDALRMAEFSPCRRYRYTLWREWLGGSGYVQFIGLNPSTATDTVDDPTIRRCVGFAKMWGFQALCMTNLFALRATDPKVMIADPAPIGPDNDKWLREITDGACLVVAAWGVGGAHLGRDIAVLGGIDFVECLGKTKNGHPRHPLYVRADVALVAYSQGSLVGHIPQANRGRISDAINETPAPNI